MRASAADSYMLIDDEAPDIYELIADDPKLFHEIIQQNTLATEKNSNRFSLFLFYVDYERTNNGREVITFTDALFIGS